MDDLYRSELMEIYRDPSHKGCLSEPSIQLEKHNTFCGDRLSLTLNIKKGIIDDAKFEGDLCFVSIIGAEFLLEKIIGKSIQQARQIDQKKLLELIDLNLSTSRVACATLILKALSEALDKYEQTEN